MVSYDDLKVDLQHRVENGQSVEDVLHKYEFEKNQKLHILPTGDAEVKQALQFLNEPSTVEGEDVYGRRDRLSHLLFTRKDYMEKYVDSVYFNQSHDQEDDVEEDEEFYTPASEELVNMRRFLIRYAFDRSRERLRLQLDRARNFKSATELRKRRRLATNISSIQLIGSQVGSTRPVSHLRFSPDDKYVAIGTWGGELSIIDSQNLSMVSQIKQPGIGKIGGIDWSPNSELIVCGTETGVGKICKSHNGLVEELATLSGHTKRITDSKFHPSGKLVATSSFDYTWRLWDATTATELQLQEGHAKELYCISFQTDGGLLCSGGLDNSCIVWDIRSGNSALVFKGHSKPIFSLDWSPNGYQVASASGDGTIKIWDLRKRENVDTILAHSNIVTKVAFEKTKGEVLVSSGYDKKINVYSSDNWRKITTLEGHTDKVLSVDISTDLKKVVSGGWDRTVKLWTSDPSII